MTDLLLTLFFMSHVSPHQYKEPIPCFVDDKNKKSAEQSQIRLNNTTDNQWPLPGVSFHMETEAYKDNDITSEHISMNSK